MNFVIGKDDEAKTVTFTIVDNIIGENLEDTKQFSTELVGEMDNFFYSLALYYNDRFDMRTEYLADLGNAQFVYGHKFNEAENHIYLVNVDPGFQESFFGEGDKEGIYEEDFEETIEHLLKNMARIETKFSPRVEFTRARQVIVELKNKIIQERPSEVK